MTARLYMSSLDDKLEVTEQHLYWMDTKIKGHYRNK